MKYAILFSAIIAGILSTPVSVDFEKFKVEYNKIYSSPEEEALRYQLFTQNFKEITEHNKLFEAGLKTYEMGVNRFTDMTTEERKMYTMYNEAQSLSKSASSVFEAAKDASAPANVDWRDKGAVNAVKDQGSCGSCWAFSTVGALEGRYFLKTKKLVSLSEQNLVDCSQKYGNYGCGGGLMRYGYNYIKDNGIESEEDYPYEAMDGVCVYNKTKSVVSVTGYTVVKSGDENALKEAIASEGPIAIAVDASGWFGYKSGIYETDHFYGLDHGVVAIGYGTTDDGKDYWLVRNSWGASWGEKGYIRVARNKDNQCGITNDACYPTLS